MEIDACNFIIYEVESRDSFIYNNISSNNNFVTLNHATIVQLSQVVRQAGWNLMVNLRAPTLKVSLSEHAAYLG